MKEIPLTRGKSTIVDDEDFDFLNQWTWVVCKTVCSNSILWYARRTFRVSTIQHNVYMHRQILNAGKVQVDHRDGNGLNNLRSNLRLATNAQNQFNRRKSKGTSSMFKGVCWNSPIGKWQASIGHEGRRHYLGNFASEVDAANAYDQAAKILFGEFSRTNFGKISCLSEPPKKGVLL